MLPSSGRADVSYELIYGHPKSHWFLATAGIAVILAYCFHLQQQAAITIVGEKERL